jgi:iron complex transport system ATP-binding protein
VRIVAGGLRVRRGGRDILDLPALEIAEGGGLFGILGPNGAGKSTLLRALSGELRPDAGRAFLGGRPVLDWPSGELARRRAVLPQSSALGVPLRAEEVVALGRLPHAGRASRAEDARAVASAMEEAGVAHLAGRFVATLSGGEQQRVQLARVLAQLGAKGPAALFLDEPTSALDLSHQHAVLRAAALRGARPGWAVVAVLHDLNLALRHCARVLLLAGGRPVAEGPPGEALRPEAVREAYGVEVRRVEDTAGGGGAPLLVVAG